MDSDLLHPRVWDHVYYKDKDRLRETAASTDPALWHRSLHARFHFGDKVAWEQIVRELEARVGPPALGLRLIVLAGLREYRQVVDIGFEPSLTDNLEQQLEESVYGKYALSVACAQLGQYADAERHLEARFFG